MQKALDRYYKKIIEYGEQYRMLTNISLKSDVALQVDEVLDQIEYYTKIYYFTWKYKRKLTADEKDNKIPIQYSINLDNASTSN